VIIPTYQEEASIGLCLELLQDCSGLQEVLVCDGGSTDHTRAVVEEYPWVRFEVAPRGRAQQMNHGARLARGDMLWFLHADCQAPGDAVLRMEAVLGDPEIALGAFRFQVDSPRWIFRILELGVRVRSTVFQVPYGDQGLFMRREDFFDLGGFPEVEVMEDLYLVRRLKERGRVHTLKAGLPTSARRWQKRGFLRTSLRNWGLVMGDWMGLYGSFRPKAGGVRLAKES
jgi:rSAM/selenodomain-associated transferase 2